MHYLKQYGARRTGTNYLRALLEHNFTDVTVLMHTLGGKHDVPVDLRKYLSLSGGDPVGFVEKSTMAAPAENALRFIEEQQSFIEAHALALTAAVDQKQLHFLISIKDPYSWINSAFKNAFLRNPLATEAMRAELKEKVKLECIRYNSLYRAYWRHVLKFPLQTTIVRYDKLVSNPFLLLDDLKNKLKLTPAYVTYDDIITTAFPTDCDPMHSTNRLGKAAFEKEYYLQQKYMDDLSVQMIATLEDEIDWKMVQNYGYKKHAR